jgi:hypothetical protein
MGMLGRGGFSVTSPVFVLLYLVSFLVCLSGWCIGEFLFYLHGLDGKRKSGTGWH